MRASRIDDLKSPKSHIELKKLIRMDFLQPTVVAANGLDVAQERTERDALALAVARAHHWMELLESGKFRSISDIAAAVGLDCSFVARMMKLTLLDPDIIEAILCGREPDGLSLRTLAKPIPLLWEEQRLRYGFSQG